VKGVCFNKKSKSWVATWKDIDGNRCSKCFSSKKYGNDVAKAKAIEHRSQMIQSLPHYREALCLELYTELKEQEASLFGLLR